jgi:hypothetical protein
LSRIGVDGVNYQEILITNYNMDIPMLGGLWEYENINELNYLASLLAETDDLSRDAYEAAAIRGDYNKSAKDLINLAHSGAIKQRFQGSGVPVPNL